VAPLFLITKRNACFAISDELTFTVLPAASGVLVPIAYHVGVRLGLWRACLVILTRDLFLLR